MDSMGYVVALGTFDGLHKGHCAVLNAALEFKNLTPLVVTFDEPPKRKNADTLVSMLMTFENKKARLNEMGFSEIFVLDYQSIHSLTPSEFLDMLFSKYNIKAVVCGFNYRFGKNRSGDAANLSDYCRSRGVESVVVPASNVSGQVVSSTLIRELISNGNIAFANMLLGRPFAFESEVIHGDERGRTIGFPTINQRLDEKLVVPKFGVYASSVTIDGKEYSAITDIGIRPTFLLKTPICETYVIDFNGDIYGKTVTVKLLEFLREEIRFDNIDDLKAAIEVDKASAIKIFNS